MGLVSNTQVGKINTPCLVLYSTQNGDRQVREMRRAKNYGRATNSVNENKDSRISITDLKGVKTMTRLYNEMYKDNQRVERINI